MKIHTSFLPAGNTLRALEQAEMVEMTADEARDLMDELPDAADVLAGAIDDAQGEVFSGAQPFRFVVIKIVG